MISSAIPTEWMHLTEDDLPYDDDLPMETQRHKLQMDLLIYSLDAWRAGRDDVYVAGDMFVYYSPDQVKTMDFKGPDLFVVTGVSNRERKSWVTWQEGKPPDVVIELLSATTQKVDKVQKKQIYQDRLGVPEYFWYDPFNQLDFAGFRLVGGKYESISPDSGGNLWSEQLGLKLVRWRGVYGGIEAVWLRWADRDDRLLPTSQELADQKQRALEQAVWEADKAKQEAARLRAKLRSLGIDPNDQ